MKTFREYCVLRETDENKHLRSVFISNMGLEDTINDKTGEDIPLEQLDLDEIRERLIGKNDQLGSALWKKLSSKVQKRADEMIREPQNKRLRDLLDILTSEPLNIGKVMGKDDATSPQTAAGEPSPAPTPTPTAL